MHHDWNVLIDRKNIYICRNALTYIVYIYLCEWVCSNNSMYILQPNGPNTNDHFGSRPPYCRGQRNRAMSASCP